ncbi:Gfo/Idh/MocA family oxidoreductase [Nocardia sp. NPDC023852]|uniref:Gfo/Idh/MocA family protein n=1 Tax=Nocardia sp. NPDC023852 TaxID=3154697 RepID=UPI0034046874
MPGLVPDPIRVGIVGANPAGSWAAATHLPALAQLREFMITAVATTRAESAAAAAAATGARLAFTNSDELVAHTEVDLVVAAVKSSGQAEIVRAALAAGKHVVCEWPLGAGTAEAAELTAAAQTAGVVNTVVLQGYYSPSVNYVKDLLAAGRIGRIASITIIAAGDPFGGSSIPQNLAWTTDPTKGSGLLTIMAGHVLATVEHLAGGLVEVSAELTNLHETITVLETGQRIANSQAGQLALAGRLADGGLVALTLHGGHDDQPDGFYLHIRGSEGTITVTPVQTGMYLHWADWNIRLRTVDGHISRLAVPDVYRTAPATLPPGPTAHVAGIYRETASAITEGRAAQPDFAIGLRQHHLLDAIEYASATGSRRAITLE